MRNTIASGTLYGKYVTLQQISKTEATKLFALDIEIYLQSSNMHPFGVWQNVCPIKLDKEQVEQDKKHYDWCVLGGHKLPVHEPTAAGQFKQIINEYSYYNCDNERGKYIHFYKQI